MKNSNIQIELEIKEHALNKLTDGVGEGVLGCDLHHELYNTDYFIIGYYEAEQFLVNECNGIFNAIEVVKDYGIEQFGEFNTEINSESIANMYAYIKGETFLNESGTLQENWGNKLTKTMIKKIIKELKSI